MFRTELHIKPTEWKIDHRDPVLSIGSCFAIHIGQKLSENKFSSLTNPFGTIFNPLSAMEVLSRCLEREPLPEWTFLQNQGVFRNYLLHSDISALQKDQLEAKIDRTIQATSDFLQKANILMLTFGTAIVYELKSNSEQVANCHKMPTGIFNKKILSIEEIVDAFDDFMEKLKAKRPGIRMILTVSPVRHIKDTFELNNVSKSILRVAVEKIINKHENSFYFPSFELMMDDLRDYRFYAEDMLHPNRQAINYIWDKFQHSYFGAETLEFIKNWGKIISAISHRPFNPDSPEHQKFIRKTLQQLDQFKGKIDTAKEEGILKNQLHDKS